MRRLFAIIFVLVMLAGCAAAQPAKEPAYSFYYLRTEPVYFSEDGIISSEQHTVHSQDDLNIILEHYLQGPTDASLVSPLPKGTKILSAQMENGTVTLIFSNEIAQYSSIDLTLACCCIAKTCIGITGCESVVIQGEDVLLNDAKSITITAESMNFLDRAASVPSQ